MFLRGDFTLSSDEGNGDDKTMIMTPSARAGHKLPAPRARLVCRNPDVLGSPAGQEILLDVSAVTIGRSPEHDVSLKADGISRNHAKFFPGDAAWGVEDMGSTNGVLVNGSKAHQAWLKPGDQIVIGTVQYVYELLRVDAPAEDEPDAMREAEKTVVMRPTVKREVTGDAPNQPRAAPPAAQPTRAQSPAGGVGARPATRSATAREAPSGSGSGMKLIIALVVVVAAAVAFLIFK